MCTRPLTGWCSSIRCEPPGRASVILLTLLTIVVPVFLVVGAGYASVRCGLVADTMTDALVKFSVTIAVPCLLFLAMFRADLGQAVHLPTLLVFYGTGTLCFFGAMALSRLVWRRRPGEAVSVGFSALFSNVVMLGIPISERAYGGTVTDAIFGIIAFHSPFIYFLGFISMELIRRDGQTIGAAVRRASVTTFSNPLMIGLGAGLGANLIGLPLPGVVESAAQMLADAALPVALFSLGGVLTRYRLREEVSEACMVSAFSLVVHPGLVYLLAAEVLALPEVYVRAAVILAAMPAGINGYIFATLYDRAVGTAANAVLIATFLSLGSITLWLAVLGIGPA